jgi:hypothetical protein
MAEDTSRWADIADRAAHTFWQGALAAAPVTVVATDWGSVKVALAAMAVGGAAALLSGLKGIFKASRRGTART